MLKLEENTATEDVRHAPAHERASAVTPLDVRQATFPSAWRGYAPKAVRSFLLDASEGYELALRENERLRQEIGRLEGSIRQYREMEHSLNNTLVHAQKVSDDMRANATQEADRVVREAQGRAELIMMAAQNRLEDAQREIDGLKLRRREAESNVESIISSLHSTLEFIRDQQREPHMVPVRARIEATN